MENGKYAYLVCVDGKANSNKYYEMKQISQSEFVAAYGREGVTRTEKVYPMRKWDSVYHNRVKWNKKPKPYDDVTHLKVKEIVDSTNDESDTDLGIDDPAVSNLLRTLQSYASGSIRRNYKVASEDVTQAMIDQAQDILNQISGLIYTPDVRISNLDINDLLEQLYTTVPRKMGNVRDHLLDFSPTLDMQLAKHLFNLEQQNIDVMAQQVNANTRQRAKPAASKQESLLDSLGITMMPARQSEIDFVRRLTGGNANMIASVFAVKNLHTQNLFDAHLETVPVERRKVETYWHGSRNENWLSILDRGLVVRPPGVASTGDMFGLGIYFADRFKKSLNYTSYRGSYYAHGNSNTGFMAVYLVHTGNQYEVGRHSSNHYNLNYDWLSSRGYDSVWGKSGYSLINNEYIVYLPQQCTVSFLVRLR